MRAHVFDMDGTLLPGTTAPLQLAKALGQEELLHEMEVEFGAGRMVAGAFSRELHTAWGLVPPELARRAFDAAPRLGGIEAGLADSTGRATSACSMPRPPIARGSTGPSR